MGTSKIEEIIEEIYEFVESCKMQPLSTTKVIVPKDELYDLLDELRLRTPDEIKRYQKIIANKDEILNDAKLKADTMIADAKEKTKVLVNEHEIMQEAYAQGNAIVKQSAEEANRILQEAKADADAIRQGAIVYTDEMLGDLERVMSNALESSKSKCDALIESLKGNLDIVSNNKRELGLESRKVEQQSASTVNHKEDSYNSENTKSSNYVVDDFDFDEDTFLDNIQ